jgi:hypothetical protein
MILLWCGVAAFGAVLAVAGAIVFLRWRVAGSLLAAFGALIALGAVTFIASWLILGGRPSRSTSPSAFADAFGYAPPPDVTNIESEVSGWNDSENRTLRFKASPATIATIVQRHHFQPAPRANCGAPACYEADPFDDAFASTHATLAYDAASWQAQFHYVGID